MSTLSCFRLSPLMNFIWQPDQKPTLSPRSWMWNGNITKNHYQHPRTWLTLLKYQSITFRRFLSGYFVWIDQVLWNYICWRKETERQTPNLVQSPPVLVNFRQVTAYLCITISKCKTNYTNPLCAALKHLWMKRIILRTIYVIRAKNYNTMWKARAKSLLSVYPSWQEWSLSSEITTKCCL